MSTPIPHDAPTDPAVQPPPRCPHCSAELLAVNTYQWEKPIAAGQALAMIFALYCPECCALLSSQVFFVPKTEASSIARPH